MGLTFAELPTAFTMMLWLAYIGFSITWSFNLPFCWSLSKPKIRVQRIKQVGNY